MKPDPDPTVDETPESQRSAPPAGSPVYVPLHEADVPRIPAGTWAHKCRGLKLDGGREIMAGQIEDEQGLLVRISRPIDGGETRSLLEFGLTWDAAHALHDVLCWHIKDRGNASLSHGDESER